MFESLMVFLILTSKFESPILQEPPAYACSIPRTKSSTLRAERPCPPSTADTCSHGEPLPAQLASTFPNDAKASTPEFPAPLVLRRQPSRPDERQEVNEESATEAPLRGQRSARPNARPIKDRASAYFDNCRTMEKCQSPSSPNSFSLHCIPSPGDPRLSKPATSWKRLCN